MYNITAYSKINDQTIQIRSLIWIFSVCIFPEDFNHATAQIYITALQALKACASK